MALRPVNVIGHRQEVTGEAHRNNDVFFVFRLLTNVVGNTVRETIVEALFNLFDEPRGLVFAFGHREVGHVVCAVIGGCEVHLATFSDFQSRVARLWEFLPQLAHFFTGTNVVAVAIKLESIGVRNTRAGVDAEKSVLDLTVFLLHIVGVIRHDKRSIHQLRQFQ